MNYFDCHPKMYELLPSMNGDVMCPFCHKELIPNPNSMGLLCVKEPTGMCDNRFVLTAFGDDGIFDGIRFRLTIASFRYSISLSRGVMFIGTDTTWLEVPGIWSKIEWSNEQAILERTQTLITFQ
jgi:hypothetical protein